MRLTHVAMVLGVCTLGGCIIRRESLGGPADDSGVAQDAFSVEDAYAPIDAFVPVDSVVPLDSVMPDACVPSCASDMLNDCAGEARHCGLGCAPTLPARCLEMRLSNVDTETVRNAVRDTAEDLLVTSAQELPACPLSTVQESGAQVCVYAYRSVRIEAALTVRGDRPVVIIARNRFEVTAAGTIRAGGEGTRPGPGGGSGGVGRGAGQGTGPGQAARSDGDFLQYDDSGASGGGFCGAGGRGGRGGDTNGPDGGAGGRTSLVPLVGGSGGGAGEGAQGDGGGGGGALQLVSQFELLIQGRVLVGGGGGQPGRGGGDWGSGGGGGSGGGLLIEAPVVNLSGATLIASGGGGGGSSGGGTANAGANGESTSVSGGSGNGGAGGSGGAGGVGSEGSSGSDNTDGVGNGGGGGGGTGVIVIRRRAGISPEVSAPLGAPCFSEADITTF